jgi:hypothetical protein
MKSLALVLALCATAAAAPLPKGFSIVPKSTSPDGKLAVIAPQAAPAAGIDTHDNKLIEIATGKVVATLVSPTAALDDSHLEFMPRWSPDGSLLEWYVDGKWGSWALVLVRVDKGAVTAQIDARELAVHEVLAEVQRAHAATAAAAKREGAGDGSWFRDGLAIDVKPAGTHDTDDGAREVPAPALPLQLEITYTSNPKQLDSYPKAAQLDGKLALAIDVRGKLTRR